MAFVLSQAEHLLEPGFRQGKKPAPRPVYSRHPVSIRRERSFDLLDLAMIGIVAAIATMLLVDGELLLSFL